MRQYLLTAQERRIIKEYLDTGKKLEGFKVLLHRCRNTETIDADYDLIKKLLKKAPQQKRV